MSDVRAEPGAFPNIIIACENSDYHRLYQNVKTILRKAALWGLWGWWAFPLGSFGSGLMFRGGSTHHPHHPNIWRPDQQI